MLNQGDDMERMTYTGPFALPEGHFNWESEPAGVREQRFPENLAVRLSEPRYGWPADSGTNSTNDREFAPGGFCPMPSGPMPERYFLTGGEVRASDE